MLICRSGRRRISFQLMTNQGQYFSPEGLEKLKKELEERRYVLRKQIADNIAEAKDLGDLKENAEFLAAKEAQAFNEQRIEELENMIKNAQLIPAGETHHGLVEVGSTVKVHSLYGEQTFTIVGASESNPAQGFISNESPLGQAFLGQVKGAEVEARTPRGTVKYKIVEVI